MRKSSWLETPGSIFTMVKNIGSEELIHETRSLDIFTHELTLNRDRPPILSCGQKKEDCGLEWLAPSLGASVAKMMRQNMFAAQFMCSYSYLAIGRYIHVYIYIITSAENDSF